MRWCHRRALSREEHDLTQVSLWLGVGDRLWGSGEGVTETVDEAAMMILAGEDGGWARVGAGEGEK